MKDILITNVRLMDPASDRDEITDIYISDGKIANIGEHLAATLTIDGTGLIAAPGLVDMRVTTGEPGQEHRETIMSAAAAAMAGGITSMVVMPDTNPVIDDISLIHFIERQGAEAPVNIHAAGAITKGLDGTSLTEIGLMSDAGAVMFSNGDTPITDAQIMRRILSYSAAFNALIAHRPVEPSLAAGGVMHEGDLSARLGLTGIPSASERIMVDRDIALAELTGGRLLIDLISSKDAVNVIRTAKSRDLDLACSVSFNNLCLNSLDIGDYRSFAKLDPPLREETDRQALIAAVNDGTIDVIVSAHNPQGAGQKRLPFAEAAAGAVGLEVMLSAALTLTHDDGLDLMALLRAMTITPAQILGISAGQIAEGATADIILIDPNRPWLVDNQALVSKSKNTPFDRRRLTGRAVKTIIDGEIVFDLDA